MVLTISIVSIVGYIISLLKLRHKFMLQQTIFVTIYLTGVTIVGQLDVLLPIYFVVSLIPLLPYIRHIKKRTFAIIVLLLIYLLYGVFFQDANASIVAFVSRYWQFIIFFLIIDCNKSIESNEDKYGKIIVFSMVFETIISFYLLGQNILQGRTVLRLISKAQPITGNMSIVILPLLLYYLYYIPRKNNKIIWTTIIISVLWVVLSGTRGYMLLCLGVCFYIIYTISFNNDHSYKNRMILSVTIIFIFSIVLLVVPGSIEKLINNLTRGGSTGIREFENRAVTGFFYDAPIHTKIFGIGLGGKPGDYPDYLSHLHEQFTLGMWDKAAYTNKSGAIFHNLYMCVICSMGLIGIVMIFICYFNMWKEVRNIPSDKKEIKRGLSIFLIGFIVMNYYRWSSTCGIAEMIFFSSIIKHTKINESGHSSACSLNTRFDSN